MNLQYLARSGVEPAIVLSVLRRRFAVNTRRMPGQVFPYRIEARDDSGRVRIRLAYFWSARLWCWVYEILPGDRP